MKNAANLHLPVRQHGAVLVVSLIMLLLMTILAISSMSDTVIQERMAGNNIDKQKAFQAAEAALRDAERFIRNTSIKIDEVVFDNAVSPETPLDYNVNNDGDSCPNGLCTPNIHTLGYSGSSNNDGCTDATFLPDRWYSCPTGTAANGNNQNVWDNNSGKFRTYSIANTLGVAQEPRYIIEFLGYTHPAGASPTNLCGKANDILWPTNANSVDICNKQQLYRITAIGYGASVSTQVVLQSTFVKTL